MILMEEGRLQLPDPVSKYLPEFGKLQVSVPQLDPLRKSDLLDRAGRTANHGPGPAAAHGGPWLWRDHPERVVREGYTKAGLYKPNERDYDVRNLTPEDEVKAISQVPLIHQPGTRWEYSLATDVLGRVVEKASGHEAGRLPQEAGVRSAEDEGHRLLRALRRNWRGWRKPLAKDPATGADNRLIDVSQVPANNSGGAGAVSTAADYLRFTQMLLNGGELDGVRILSAPTTVKLMASDHLGTRIQPVVSPGEQLLGTPGYTFGLGFMVRPENGIAGVPGSKGEFMWAGYAGTFFWIDPVEDITAVMMTQAPGPSRPYYRKLIKQLVYQAVVESKMMD